MRPKPRTLPLTGFVALGVLLGVGTSDAKAQVFVATPGFAVGVGAPVVAPPAVGVVPAYPPAVGVYPGYVYPPVVAPYPVVRPYPVYGPPVVYGPRPYYRGPYYGYRRW